MIYLFCCHFHLWLPFCCARSIYTLYGHSVMWCASVYVEPNQDCPRACPPISKRALCNAHKAPPHPALARSANPAGWQTSNDKFQLPIITSPTSASPRFSLRPFLMSVHRTAWGTWEDLPNSLPLGATKFCKSVSPVFGSFEKSGLSAWQCGSDMVGIHTQGALLAFTSPFVKRDRIYYLLSIRGYCEDYLYTAVI